MGIAEDRNAFVERVRENSPGDAEPFGGIVDDLIAWSLEHSWGLQHIPRGDQIQSVVKFALVGMNAPFWTAYPRKQDGAKLTVVDSVGGVFSNGVCAEARRVLAALDGRVPESNEAPTISFQRLRDADTVRQVKRLLCRLLVEMDRHD